MMRDVLASPWLWLPVLLGLFAGAYYIQQMPQGRRRQRKRPESQTFCAWCVFRDGEDCTSPNSPVCDQACGPVCWGNVKCELQRC